MSNNYNKLVTGVFCGFLGVVLGASVLLPDKDFSELENRNLSKVPVLSLETLKDGKFMLNGKSVFQRLVLDQGYYHEGVITAPTE